MYPMNWSDLRSRLHEQIKPPLIAQILDPYEVSQDKFAQKRLFYLLM